MVSWDACVPLPITHYPLPITHYPLPITHYPLPITHYPLPITPLMNDLIRDGISQRQRQLTALSPDFVKVDERDAADFLVFAYRLSQQIIYYKASGQPDDNQRDGDWQEFFKGSTTVQIALISKTRPQIVRDKYNQQLQTFLLDRTPTNLAAIIATWREIFQQIQEWYQGLAADTPLQAIIKGLVQTNLQQPLLRMLDWESLSEPNLLRRFNSSNFARVFELRLNINAVPSIQPINDRSSIRSELDGVFQVLFQNYRQIILLAPEYLVPSLAARTDLQPHLALYLGFWEVLKPARDDLNRMTQRHLDFFYRRVLRLPEKPATPDLAHLIFELAKFQLEYKLDRNTAFKAGKDAKGVELFYQLNQEILIHQAQIVSLKGLFLASLETGKVQPVNITGLHSSPVANSVDGQGKEFPKEQIVKAWQPFGNVDRPHAKIGLAIASDIFYLQESTRTVTLNLTFDHAPIGLQASDLLKIFIVDFSGEKDWIVGDILSSSSLINSSLKLVVEVKPEGGSIESYHSQLSGAALSTDKPVARIHLKAETRIQGLSAYNYFRDLKLIDLSISTNVNEVRNLILQNDLSVLDPTKPFPPFGSSPKAGMNFYIGSKEVFQQRLTSLKIDLRLETKIPKEWANCYAAYGVDANFKPGQILVKALRDKQFQPSSGIDRDLFELNGSPFDLTELTNLKLDKFAETEPVEIWNYQSTNGFIQLQLTGQDFLHSQYATVLARQVLAAATNEIITVPKATEVPKATKVTEQKRKAVIDAYYKIGSGNPFPAKDRYIDANAEPLLPKEPFTPVIQSLSLSYTAAANRADCQLFHLHPFDGFLPLSNTASSLFMPQFINEGELILGLENLAPPIALPLLFQVAEETANTDLPKTEVQWYYLTNNIWQAFKQHQIVSDGTNGLIKSGIVNLAIPAEISTGNTLLDPSLYWIKVGVAKRSGAICNIVGVHTQAAQVTFNDRDNEPTHLVAPLPAGSIAKLADPQPEVSKVAQPYDSFGGQPQENPNSYYTRISEQLRHKGRAVTIFDYERLVLEQFPAVYKVRCINHSRVDELDNFQSLVPGSVTLAVIPDLSKRSTTNDLEPKVNINLLAEIADYLKQLSSPWVDLRVVNPRYEAIQVEFEVQFKVPYQANFDYYQRELQRGIVGFLSPWTISSGAEIHFGGEVYRSSILNFVEEQSYVDYVVNFQMHQGDRRNLQTIVASSPRSILVSVPFGDTIGTGHLIQPAGTCPPNRGILGNG
jgi:Baseplate J-like protein